VPTYAELQTETWWGREITPDPLRALGLGAGSLSAVVSADRLTSARAALPMPARVDVQVLPVVGMPLGAGVPDGASGPYSLSDWRRSVLAAASGLFVLDGLGATRSTVPTPAPWSMVGVLLVIWVACLAKLDRCAFSGRPLAAQQVGSAGHCFQMLWVATAADPAQVVQLSTLGDGSAPHFVGYSVDVTGSASRHPDLRVSVGLDVLLPEPAPVAIDHDGGENAVLQGLRCGSGHGIYISTLGGLG
jgi:hypothetical protein